MESLQSLSKKGPWFTFPYMRFTVGKISGAPMLTNFAQSDGVMRSSHGLDHPLAPAIRYISTHMQNLRNTFHSLAEALVTVSEVWQLTFPLCGGRANHVIVDFGLNEVTYVVVRLIQTFKSITSEDPRDWVEGGGIALESKNGVKVSLQRA